MDKPFGVILAGGASRRMGGRDKALLPLGGRTLLERAVARLGPQCRALAISANGPDEAYGRFGLRVLRDSGPAGSGPLAGVLAGLDWAAAEGGDRIVTAAVDTPFFPLDLVARLEAAATSGLVLAASLDADDAAHRHPTFGLWPVALREDLRGALEAGVRKVRDWADGHAAATAAFPAADADPFFNINTPADLDLAAAMLDRAG